MPTPDYTKMTCKRYEDAVFTYKHRLPLGRPRSCMVICSVFASATMCITVWRENERAGRISRRRESICQWQSVGASILLVVCKLGKGGGTLSSAGGYICINVSDFPEKLNCYRDFQEDGHVRRKLPGKWTTHLQVHGQSTSASLIRHRPRGAIKTSHISLLRSRKTMSR